MADPNPMQGSPVWRHLMHHVCKVCPNWEAALLFVSGQQSSILCQLESSLQKMNFSE
jgi:hypothetical protein